MRTKLLYLFLSLCFLYSYCNNTILYVEIPNSNNIPLILSAQKNKIVLGHHDTKIKNILDKYEIYRFEKAFPDSKKIKLQNVYLIECNKDTLGNELSFYKNYFNNVEKSEVPSLLYTTNDYYIPGDYYTSKNYDLINVNGAWDYSRGSTDFYVGVSEGGIKNDHQDLLGKTISMYATPLGPSSHATAVAGVIAANTDNNLGMSGVGFNSKVISLGYGFNDMLILSQQGVRIINCSWGSANSWISYEQDIIDEIYENGTILIVSAGNGFSSGSNTTEYYYPASYNHVISVSSVGSQEIGWIAPVGSAAGKFANWRDHVEGWIGYPNTTHQINDKVDILAPGFGCFTTTYNPNAPSTNLYGPFGGTSSAAPHVSGVASLILTANNCLNVDELESIIKLSAVSVDSIASNTPYLGGLGAGRINAETATKIAWQMNPANGGEVLLNNRIFNRWNFVLSNSPESIRIKNEQFIENAEINFKAKKSIILDINTLLEPGTGKSHYLHIDNTNTCFILNKVNKAQIVSDNLIKNINDHENMFSIYPNPVKDILNIEGNKSVHKSEVVDMTGKIVTWYGSNNHIDVQNLIVGEYVLRIYDVDNKISTIKFIKK